MGTRRTSRRRPRKRCWSRRNCFLRGGKVGRRDRFSPRHVFSRLALKKSYKFRYRPPFGRILSYQRRKIPVIPCSGGSIPCSGKIFPVPFGRELACNMLELLDDLVSRIVEAVKKMQIPCYFPCSQFATGLWPDLQGTKLLLLCDGGTKGR